MTDSIGIIAAGQNGTFRRTANGGTTWSVSVLIPICMLIPIYMKNVNEGFAIGYFGAKLAEHLMVEIPGQLPISISPQNLHNMAFY
ncbi:MAG: hypothetical protein IPN13_16495 [Bacteroidetes bacterium]|nr:hypothetical protein [Bacteroidota bacterium]